MHKKGGDGTSRTLLCERKNGGKCGQGKSLMGTTKTSPNHENLAKIKRNKQMYPSTDLTKVTSGFVIMFFSSQE